MRRASREYCTWRQQFIRDRLHLTIWIALGFLVIIAGLNLGMLLPAMEHRGEVDEFLNGDRFWLLARARLITPAVGLIGIWIMLRYVLPIHRLMAAFLGYSIALIWIPQIHFSLQGEAFLDFGTWLIFFTLQAVLISVRWAWHLLSQGLALGMLMVSAIVVPYTRSPNRRQTLGLGLGLYIRYQIVTAHGGEIGVLSSPDQGVTFWFTLPCG